MINEREKRKFKKEFPYFILNKEKLIIVLKFLEIRKWNEIRF